MQNNRSTGSVTFGAILIILGLLFLLDNFYFIDIGYLLEEFWPVALIILGAHIILKNRKTGEVETKEIIDSSIE